MLSSVIAMIIAIFLMPSFRPIELSGYTMYDVTLNGESVGTVSSEEEAQSDLIEARRKVASGSDDLICVSADLSCTGRNVLWGTVDRHSDVVNAMADILDKDKDSTLTRCFTLKIGSYMAALASRDDIRQLLSDVSARYDTENQYLVSLVPDTDRQLGCLTAKISTAKEQEVENQNINGFRKEDRDRRILSAGIADTECFRCGKRDPQGLGAEAGRRSEGGRYAVPDRGELRSFHG